LTELDGKTMGIIGFGRIGRTTAQIAQAFGMRVLVHDSQPIRNSADAGVEVVPLERLYAEADVVSLHCPLFPETRGMICSESLARMKQGVFLINTSRGPLVVEEDLAAALRSGKVAGAAVDVVSSEPIRIDNPLLSAPNCLITPHIAWAPKESRARLLGIAIGNLSAFLDGTPVNVVNP
jgi:glycerate dehydrogenase